MSLRESIVRELSLDELLSDPIVRLAMRREGGRRSRAGRAGGGEADRVTARRYGFCAPP